MRAERAQCSTLSPFDELRAHIDKLRAHCFRHAQRSDPSTLGTAPP
jgi:hypothetical protein